MSADSIIYCLEHLTDHRQFERLGCDLMAGAGFGHIDPLGGTGDRGRDALYRNAQGDLTVFAFTLRADWRRKLGEDLRRIAEESHDPARVVFICASSLTASEKDSARSFVEESYGWDFELYDLERIRVLLAGELRHLIAAHPAIFVPPFFPQSAGLSIAESHDTILIDHVASDHALATWLARRLSLAGFKTWCHGTAPLAGQNPDEAVRLLVQRRASQYLPVLSSAAIASRDFMDRCASAAGLRPDFCVPCLADNIDPTQLGTRLAQTRPARFDTSWATGLAEVLGYLRSKGVGPAHDADRGRQVALREYVPVAVTRAVEEPVFANVFKVSVPGSILVCDLRSPLGEEQEQLRKQWAFVEASALQLLSFTPPPKSVPLEPKKKLPEFAWDSYQERYGKKTINVVKELVKRSLDVACCSAGMIWCDRTEVYYFPDRSGKEWNQTIRHVDGRQTTVQLTGERQKGWGERAEKFRYQLSPSFKVGRDDNGSLWITVKVYVRSTSRDGTPFERKERGRRRKLVTGGWWNREWLARILGVTQALETTLGEIRVGDLNRGVVVDTQPLAWRCPIGLDLEALERIKDFGEEIAIAKAGAGTEDDADADEEAGTDPIGK